VERSKQILLLRYGLNIEFYPILSYTKPLSARDVAEEISKIDDLKNITGTSVSKILSNSL